MWPFKKAKSAKPFEILSDHAVLNFYNGADEYYRVPETYENVPVTEIAANAFKDAKHVKGVFMGKNIQKIGKKAFAGCSGDLRLVLNEQAERAEGALTGVKSVYFENESGLTLVSYAGHETEIILEDECFSIPVTGVGEKVFYMFAYLKSIRLPAKLKEIGRAAFAGCSDLTTIDFPASLEVIASEAFVKSGLTSVTFPENVKTVGDHAFAGCRALEKAAFKGKNTFLAPGAFAKCGLTCISLPENLTELQSETLRENKRLTHVQIPKSVEAVWEYALADTGLTAAELPETTEVIAEGAFANAQDLESVCLGSSIREIGQSAFSFCPKLKTLRLTEGKFKIENALLIDAENRRIIACLTPLSPGKIVVPDGITEISDSAFAGNDKIEVLILPKSVKRIGAWAMRDMKNLKTLEIQSDALALGDSPLFGTHPENLICTDEIAEMFAEMDA
ncbi:MAG: leucine-rich repeat domain-containing protein [Clostridia bacterium]|nr:leucine-rich repeat domain-containing protein [Clostridia bacterium]